jgi:hypothetical protein
MDPIIFEFLGGLLVGAMAGLMVVLRIRHPTPATMAILAVRKTRSAASVHRRRTSPARDRTAIASAKTRRRAKTKTPEATISRVQAPTPSTASATVSFDTCPSCGLQAPGSLLAEHFLGSPSHKNGPPEIVKVEPADIKAAEEAEKEDSKQSMRDLLQMLVPPRAFGRRHAHRSMGPISSIVKDLGTPHRRLS